MRTESVSTILRVLMGSIFIATGLAKFETGLGNVGGWFDSMGIPSFFAHVVAYLELLGGIALVIGLGTRYLAVAFAALMIGAIVMVKLPLGLLGDGQAMGYAYELCLLAMAAYFAISEHQGFGVDQLAFKKNKPVLTKVN